VMCCGLRSGDTRRVANSHGKAGPCSHDANNDDNSQRKTSAPIRQAHSTLIESYVKTVECRTIPVPPGGAIEHVRLSSRSVQPTLCAVVKGEEGLLVDDDRLRIT
jgi:hypothetical protein